MATYASTTNPFIEPSNGSPSPPPLNAPGKSGEGPTSSRQARKCSPGMARPRRSSDDELDKENAKQNKSDESNLLLDEVVVPKTTGDNILDLLEVHNSNGAKQVVAEGEEPDLEITRLDASQKQQPPPHDDDDNNDFGLAIDETCSKLVEQASKLTLSSVPDASKLQPELPIADVSSLGNRITNTSKRHANLSSDSLSSPVAKSSSIESDGVLDLGRKTGEHATSENTNEDDDDVLDGLATNTKENNNSANRDSTDRLPMSDSGGRQHQHIELIKKLRLQLRDLERYAYERGELEQVPPSILAERQSVILDKLRKRLSLNLDRDKIEKLELEELKRQVDEEINNLIDPLLTKEHLLNQLKTQLTDLERYISHLHGSIGKGSNDKSGDCSCSLHGCSSSIPSSASSSASSTYSHSSKANETNRSIITSETLPKTSRLIRGLMAQLICSDIKIQEAMRVEGELERKRQNAASNSADKVHDSVNRKNHKPKVSREEPATTKAPQFHDGAAWTLHIDRVILATDSLTNLLSPTPKKQPEQKTGESVHSDESQQQQQVDGSLIESVVRRQLIPATRDLLSYGLIDPSSMPSRSSYVSFLIDPYYLLTSFSCLPGVQARPDNSEQGLPIDKAHIWDIIVDYYESKNEVNFRTSSVKTLSQSFSLTPSMDGPIKITSKQALLIAVDDILCQLAKRKPNGPESHFKLFVYTALNQGKLATWIRLVFKNKSISKKYYHDFSFVNQPEKMDKFLATIEALGQHKFGIDTDAEITDQFVSAF